MEAKDSSQVLQSNKKSRLRWTKLLHDCFVKAVNQLGGAFEATPKGIVEVMGIKEITTDHIKSYLQKYRLREVYRTAAYTKDAWNENEQRRNLARHTNETSRYIQTSKGKRPLIEGQTNFYKESEVSAPKTIKIHQPATNSQPHIHPLSSWITLYEASQTNHETQTAAAKADYAYTSVNEKLQIRQTAKPKSESFLATTSTEDKGLLSCPSASMRDGIFVGKTMTEHQSYHVLKSSSDLQGYTSKESKLTKTYEPIDLNVSAQERV